jgi:hypothetical protein
MSKPEDIPQGDWNAGAKIAQEYVSWLDHGNSTGNLSEHATTALADSFARTILAAKAEERQKIDDLVDCLSDMTFHYVSLAGCGDCGNWNPEEESEVIAARQMIARHREVNTAHKISEG